MEALIFALIATRKGDTQHDDFFPSDTRLGELSSALYECLSAVENRTAEISLAQE